MYLGRALISINLVLCGCGHPLPVAGTGPPIAERAQLLLHLFLCPELYAVSVEEFRCPQVDVLSFQVHFLRTGQEHEIKHFLQPAELLQCLLGGRFA